MDQRMPRGRKLGLWVLLLAVWISGTLLMQAISRYGNARHWYALATVAVNATVALPMILIGQRILSIQRGR
jgi:hypothetical protein